MSQRLNHGAADACRGRLRRLAAALLGTVAVAAAGGALAQAPGRPGSPPLPNPQAMAQGNAQGGTGFITPPGDPALQGTRRDVAGPDLSALRYYLQSKQKERAEAEIKRIQRLYPSWKMPADIYDTTDANVSDEQPFWALFAADRIDELKAAIKAKMAAEPGWQPSRDLVRKTRRKELRLMVEKLAKDNKQKQIVAYVKDSGIGAQDIDVDILWLIAQAEARTGLLDQSLNTYKVILQTDNNEQERIATVQKAMAVLPMRMVDELVSMGRTVDGHSEFDAIAIDITRGRISAYLKEERTEDIPAPEMQQFEAYARGDADPNQTALVAWYYYNHKMYREALEWFKLAIEKGGDGMVAHGLALSLLNLEMRREAEEVAYAWRDTLINNLILYIDILERDLTKPIPPYIETERLVRYGQVSMEITSGEGAQGLAWYAYNSCQFDVALMWFERAMAWYPKEATAYGYALALEKVKRRGDEMVVINRYDGLFAKVVAIIFPDGLIRPPGPCDTQPTAVRQDNRRGRREAYLDPNASAIALSQRYPNTAQSDASVVSGMMPTGQYGQAGGSPRVPGPSGTFTQDRAVADALRMPRIDRKEFPISVNPANPLRFASVPRPGVDAGAAPASPFGPTSLRFAQEPYNGPWPLVARRVPGVGPMPYERYGYTLLPGWNGITEPTIPPYSAQNAPAGTLWADQRHADQYIAGR